MFNFETFTPISKNMKEVEKKLMTEHIEEVEKCCSSMMNITEEKDYLEISEHLYSLLPLLEKEIHLFSNSLKIKKIKDFFLRQISAESAILYNEFVNEINEKLNIYGNKQKQTLPVGVVQTALNELEKEGYAIKLQKHHKTYIYRIK